MYSGKHLHSPLSHTAFEPHGNRAQGSVGGGSVTIKTFIIKEKLINRVFCSARASNIFITPQYIEIYFVILTIIKFKSYHLYITVAKCTAMLFIDS